MEKKYKEQLIISVLFASIVIASLFFMYPIFSFHTYDEVVYYDYLLTVDDKQVVLENFEIYKNESISSLGGGTLYIEDETLWHGENELKVKIQGFDKERRTVENQYVITKDNKEYSLVYATKEFTKKDKENKITNIVDAKITIQTMADVEVYSSKLAVTPMHLLIGSNKEYRIENAYISDYVMHVGKLSVNSEIEKKYPSISLEYRYVKDKKKDEYVVFKKIIGQTKEYLKSNTSDMFYQDKKDGSLIDKDLSVVVILSNDKDEYVFSIDLQVNKVGETNE